MCVRSAPKYNHYGSGRVPRASAMHWGSYSNPTAALLQNGVLCPEFVAAVCLV